LAGNSPRVHALDESIVDANESVIAFDPLRVTLEVGRYGRSGVEVGGAPWKPGEGGVEIEFHTQELIVLLYGVGDANGDSTGHVIDPTWTSRTARIRHSRRFRYASVAGRPTVNASVAAADWLHTEYLSYCGRSEVAQ
jgi:hypothetical protein